MSSKRRIRRNSCTGKTQYQTDVEGKTAIYFLKQRTKDTSLMNVYKCKFCKHYHIGHAVRTTFHV